jgi:hypothetical protein
MAMNNLFFTVQPGEFQPGEFIELTHPSESTRIGRIIAVHNESLSVTRWVEDVSIHDEDQQDSFFLPKFLVPTSEIDIIPKQRISSLVFVFNAGDLEKYKIRYVYGMKNIFIANRNINLATPLQPISFILLDCIYRI